MISLGVMGAIQDKYGIFYRTETAKMAGVTDQEIKAVAELVKQEVGWGPFLRLNQIDFDEFKQETMQAIQQFQKKQEARVRTAM
jgi:alkylhydroperoxidase/carboxymuconolactone decarboxylase family protein YurZ